MYGAYVSFVVPAESIGSSRISVNTLSAIPAGELEAASTLAIISVLRAELRPATKASPPRIPSIPHTKDNTIAAT